MTFTDFSTLFSPASIDLAMLIFLWLVQLIIYPSFKQISKDLILSWHKTYQSRVCIIMGPIMLMQIYDITIDFIHTISPLSTIRFLLLVSSWLLTVLISVPLHRKIERNEELNKSIDRLIRTNLPRTFTWTVIYLTHFL